MQSMFGSLCQPFTEKNKIGNDWMIHGFFFNFLISVSLMWSPTPLTFRRVKVKDVLLNLGTVKTRLP